MYEFKKIQDIAKGLKEQTHSLANMDIISVQVNRGAPSEHNPFITFTQDMYDGDGKILTWGNKRLGLGLRLTTNNRYKSYQDASVFLDRDHMIRDDIIYND